MIIHVDTDSLRDLANAADAACSSLEEAANILMQITTHQDWVCQNKERINSLIISNHTQISSLFADATLFDNAIVFVANDFLEQESKISQSFETLETLLSQTLSIEPMTSGTISSIASNFMTPGNFAGQIPVSEAETFIEGLSEGTGE